MQRLLVVDDEWDVADALRDLLSDRYEVTLAGKGSDALDLLERQRFDIVLLDWMLPVVTGEQVVRELRARGVRTPVILSSAATDLAACAHRCGASDFIRKPFDLSVLERKLVRVLEDATTASASPLPLSISIAARPV